MPVMLMYSKVSIGVRDRSMAAAMGTLPTHGSVPVAVICQDASSGRVTSTSWCPAAFSASGTSSARAATACAKSRSSSRRMGIKHVW